MIAGGSNAARSGGGADTETVPSGSSAAPEGAEQASGSRAKGILERLESEVWTSANDLADEATIRSATDRTAYRHEHDLLVATERRFTRTLSESQAAAHDFDAYRDDPDDRHRHDPEGFEKRTVEYLLSDPAWRTCGDCGGEGEMECTDCGGDGVTNCIHCGGAGERTCTDCQGSGIGEVPCPRCNGQGVVDGTYEEYEICAECEGTETVRRDGACPACDGEGTVGCDFCDESGESACSNCDDGIVTCETCEGAGRVQAFEVLERSYDHQRKTTYTARGVPPRYLAEPEGTVAAIREREHPHDSVVNYRVTSVELDATAVEYEYDGDRYEVYEVEGEHLEAPSYPQRPLREYAPYACTVAAMVLFLSGYLLFVQ